MTRPSLDRLLNPRTIAVVGASPSPNKIGQILMRNLDRFEGDVYPIHPTAPEILGRRAYPNVSAVPARVDLALLAIPAAGVTASIRDCGAAGVGACVVYSGGWGESGPSGAAQQQEMQRVAAESGVRLLGPNTSGFVAPLRGLYATFVADLPATLKPGGLAIVAQSGGVNLTMCFLAQNEGLGVRLGVGLGNAADVTWHDVLDYLADAQDETVRVVALAIEGVNKGHALCESVRRLVDRCPVVALVLGRSDVAPFAQSHTGALTGSYRVTRAALAQAGAVVVDDLTELMDAARALGALRLPPKWRPGVGVVTAQAGPGLLLADALGAADVFMPLMNDATQAALGRLLPPITYQKNPVDTGRPGPTFPEVLRTVRGADDVDLLAVSLLHEPDAVNPAQALKDVAPVILSSQGPRDAMSALRDELQAAGVPVFQTPDRAAKVIAALVRDAQQSARRAEKGPVSASTTKYRPEESWDEASAKRLLEELGLATPRRISCRTHAEAHGALETIGAPVVVKLLHPNVTHKSDVGGVHLGVRTLTDLDNALAAIDRTPGAGYLVEQAVLSGPELLIGARRDPTFGAVVVLGAGGVGAEFEDDIAVRLAPVTPAEAASMLDDLSARWRYRGGRGALPVDEAELARVLVTIGVLITQRDDIAELEINPMRVTASGLVALDALVVPT